jgi:flagella basal body P-ring formation protein FlgA
MNPRARHGLATAACLLGMLWCAGAGAATPDVANTPAASAQAAAEQAVRERFSLPGSRAEVAAMALDPRLQLAACTVPLRAVIAKSIKAAPRLAVSVLCPQAGGWSARVTVKLQLFRRVLVTNHPLLRGDGLGVADVHAEERDVTHLGYGYIENIEQVAGRTLSRALPTGSVLTPAALGGRRMVRAGDHVQMIARLGNIEVRATGVALGSGDNGARLRVRNADSGKVIDGMVSAPGEVVALP